VAKRALTLPFEQQIDDAVTTPGYLVQIDFSTPLRLCTRGNVVFNGSAFSERAIDVSALTTSGGNASMTGSLKFQDLDRLLAAYILTENFVEKRTRVWKYYGDVADGASINQLMPVNLFDGYIDGCQIDGSWNVSISLLSGAGDVTYVPNKRITAENGFNWLPQKGKVIDFGGEKFTLEPEV
jgi:hypothetical protein